MIGKAGGVERERAELSWFCSINLLRLRGRMGLGKREKYAYMLDTTGIDSLFECYLATQDRLLCHLSHRIQGKR